MAVQHGTVLTSERRGAAAERASRRYSSEPSGFEPACAARNNILRTPRQRAAAAAPPRADARHWIYRRRFRLRRRAAGMARGGARVCARRSPPSGAQGALAAGGAAGAGGEESPRADARVRRWRNCWRRSDTEQSCRLRLRHAEAHQRTTLARAKSPEKCDLRPPGRSRWCGAPPRAPLLAVRAAQRDASRRHSFADGNSGGAAAAERLATRARSRWRCGAPRRRSGARPGTCAARGGRTSARGRGTAAVRRRGGARLANEVASCIAEVVAGRREYLLDVTRPATRVAEWAREARPFAPSAATVAGSLMALPHVWHVPLAARRSTISCAPSVARPRRSPPWGGRRSPPASTASTEPAGAPAMRVARPRGARIQRVVPESCTRRPAHPLRSCRWRRLSRHSSSRREADERARVLALHLNDGYTIAGNARKYSKARDGTDARGRLDTLRGRSSGSCCTAQPRRANVAIVGALHAHCAPCALLRDDYVKLFRHYEAPLLARDVAEVLAMELRPLRPSERERHSRSWRRPSSRAARARAGRAAQEAPAAAGPTLTLRACAAVAGGPPPPVCLPEEATVHDAVAAAADARGASVTCERAAGCRLYADRENKPGWILEAAQLRQRPTVTFPGAIRRAAAAADLLPTVVRGLWRRAAHGLEAVRRVPMGQVPDRPPVHADRAPRAAHEPSDERILRGELDVRAGRRADRRVGARGRAHLATRAAPASPCRPTRAASRRCGFADRARRRPVQGPRRRELLDLELGFGQIRVVHRLPPRNRRRSAGNVEDVAERALPEAVLAPSWRRAPRAPPP